MVGLVEGVVKYGKLLCVFVGEATACPMVERQQASVAARLVPDLVCMHKLLALPGLTLRLWKTPILVTIHGTGKRGSMEHGTWSTGASSSLPIA